ncbi:MAG: ABC transporter ATP-binding protein [Oscillospiraceae bacterium]|nr:ABC transporter ATP-binding protein [Oscillospiraceae bacterium]
MSPKSQQQREAAEKYLKEKVETIAVRVPKGKKDVIVAHAAKHDGSVNAFMNRAVEKTMELDNSATDENPEAK